MSEVNGAGVGALAFIVLWPWVSKLFMTKGYTGYYKMVRDLHLDK